MKRAHLIFYLTSACIFFTAYLHANVPITNFSPAEYDAGMQNWSLAIQKNGWVYAANSYGLLEFDGAGWQLYGVWGGSALRSVAIAPDSSVYVGSTNEFGFFSANNIGQLEYQSLSIDLPKSIQQHFGEIWNIHFLNDLAFFQSSSDIFIYNINADTLYNIIHRDEHIFCSATVNNGVYVATASGVYALVGNSLNLLKGSNLLSGYEIRSIAPLSASSFLIATDLGGIYIYDGRQILPFETPVDSFLRKNQLYTMTINDSFIALGTVSNGLVLINIATSEVVYISKSEGLQNNTVLSLAFDELGYLWAGLDQGVAHIFVNYPIVNLFGNSLSIGAGYTAVRFNDSMYLGTNQGVYLMSEESAVLLDGSQGQVWSLDTVGGRLICCHHRGLYEIVGNKFVPLSAATGFWNVSQIDSQNVLLGSYQGFYRLHLSGGKPSITKVDGFDETAYNYELDAENNIWFNGVDGVYKISLNDNRLHVDTVMLKSVYQEPLFITKYDDNVLITSHDSCMMVDDNGNLIDAAPYLLHFAGNGLYYRIIRDNDGNEWFLMPHELYIRPTGSESPDIIISDSHFFIDGFYFISQIDNHALLIGSVDGFYILNRDLLKLDDNPLIDRVYIREMLTTNHGDSIVYGESYPPVSCDITLSYDENSLRFKFGAGVLSQCEYSLRLEPLEDDYGQWTVLNIKEYTSLHEGKYKLHVRMRAIGTNQVVETVLPFRIRPPWYRHWLAIVLYILIILVLACFVYHVVQQYMKHKYQQESLEKEKRILELEKERTESDLRHKSQEMSNLLLSQVNRQEILQEVQADLYAISDALGANDTNNAKKRLHSLLEKVSKMSANDVDWNKFEENFDIVNDKFIEKLKAKYPTLNKNERKLCVYIRLGLYNKEIAPLLNMSTRGVEMLRYRMRRKMGLEREDNLEQLMLKI